MFLMSRLVSGSGNTPVSYLPVSEEVDVPRESGRVKVTDGQQQVRDTDALKAPLPDKLLNNRNTESVHSVNISPALKEIGQSLEQGIPVSEGMYRELNQVSGSDNVAEYVSADEFVGPLTKQFYQDALQRIEKANEKIQQLKARHISKDALVSDEKWTPVQLESWKQHCHLATQELRTELQSLINDLENNNQPSADSHDAVANLSLRAFWLRDEILFQTMSERITQALPVGIEQALKTKQKKDMRQLEMNGKDKLVAFNMGVAGFSGLLTTARLFIASLPENASKSEFGEQMVTPPRLSDKERVMHQGEFPQTLLKTELLRKITTRMNNLRKSLEGDDLSKLDSLYLGESAKIGGIDFIDHADGRVPDDFVYTRDIINQLQHYLQKLELFAEGLSIKYALDSEYF